MACAPTYLDEWVRDCGVRVGGTKDFLGEAVGGVVGFSGEIAGGIGGKGEEFHDQHVGKYGDLKKVVTGKEA